MNIVTLDFETYFDDEYTLKKLTTEAYIRDPRFAVHGVGIRTQEGHLYWEDDLRFEFMNRDFSNTAVLCHHAQFDGLILSHHFGIKPALWLDTLSMARQVLGTHVSASLDSLARHYGLAAKSVPYEAFKGKRPGELPAATRKMLAEGCLHDVELTWDIFQRLARSFPKEEYAVVDMTVRMFTEPVLTADLPLLGDVWMREERTKGDMLAALGVRAEDLQSNERFAALLRDAGAEPEMKAGKNGEIFAFARTDDFMKDLLDSDNPTLAALAQARLGVKSTIDQTRAERLGWMARRGPMPVYLRYCGAHTTRWSGGDGVNWQNFRRGGDIRKAIRAPEGYLLAVVDASQIECRILNMVAGQTDVIERFRRGEDPYIGIASQAYGRPVTKADASERGTGKQLELSCGYGAGAETIRNTAKLGIYGPPVLIDDETALRWRNIYRETHPHVVNYWAEAGRMISRLASAGYPAVEWGPLTVRDQRVYAPNGGWVDYSTLEYSEEWQSWRVRKRNGWTRLYGGKLVENVVQFLARVVLSQTMLRVRQRGLRVVNCTHDEMIVLVKADGTERAVYEWLLAEMSRAPAWMPGIPLAAEGALEEFYAK